MTPALTDKLFVTLGAAALAAFGTLIDQLAKGDFSDWRGLAGRAAVCLIAVGLFVLRAKHPSLFTGWTWADKGNAGGQS
jgi:hypothetical protein